MGPLRGAAKEERLKKLVAAGCGFVALLGTTAAAASFRPLPLTSRDQKALQDNFALCLSKLKGPYTENFCVCPDGRKVAVRGANGQVGAACKNALFCAAFRAPWAEALAKQRMYIANLFSRDLYLWNSFPDHNDLVRGYILEKYFTETNPASKLSRLRSFGGLSGAEYETPASARFFERYLSAPEFKDNRHFLLAYELQKRYFVREDLGQIEKVRAMSSRIQAADPEFKPLRDAIHNQLSPGLVPQLMTYRDRLPPGTTRSQIDELTKEINKLTSLDEGAFKSQVAQIEDEALRSQLTVRLPAPNADRVDAISSLASLMVLARQTVAGRKTAPGDARRLIDLDITLAGLIQNRGNALLESGAGLPAKRHLQLLSALTDATYGAGLLGEREREAAGAALRDLMSAPRQSRRNFTAKLREAERVVEWAQSDAVLAFAEVWAPWTMLLPPTASIRDDILRSSPMLLYARVARRLDEYATGGGRLIIKEASAMTPQDKAVYEEYTRNQTRSAAASLGNQRPRLHIDRAKIDLSRNMPIGLNAVRRKDSGRFCGPKAAYLGELKHLFPDHVARGIVVPFGAYYDHYRNVRVAVPDKLRGLGIPMPGERLPDFAERTYKEFFGVMMPARKSEKDLAAWITPRDRK